MTHFNRMRGTRYTRYEVYEVYESSADAAYKAAALCLSTVPVVGYTPPQIWRCSQSYRKQVKVGTVLKIGNLDTNKK